MVALKRAGMDYWNQVHWQRWSSWTAFRDSLPSGARLWFIEQGGSRRHSDVAYRPGDFLVFGRETAGLPRDLLESHREAWLRLPMFRPESRSLNLGNCVAIAVYEALRQMGFPGEAFDPR